MSQTKEQKDSKDAKSGGKIRVFALASELNLDTKTVLEFCKELGFTGVKNQLSSLESDQCDSIRDRAKKGAPKAPTLHASPASAKPVVPPKLDKIPTLAKPKTPTPTKAAPAAETVAHGPAVVSPPTPAVVAPTVAPPEPTPVETPISAVETKSVEPVLPVIEAMPISVAPAPVEAIEEIAPPTIESVVEAPAVAAPTAAPPATASPSGRVPHLSNRPPNLAANRPPGLGSNRPQTRPPAPAPTPPSPPSQSTPPQPPAPARPAAPATGTAGHPPTRPAPHPGGPTPSRPPGLGQGSPGAPRPGGGHGPGQRSAPGGVSRHGGGHQGGGAQRAGGLPPRQGTGPGGGGGGPRGQGQGPGGQGQSGGPGAGQARPGGGGGGGTGTPRPAPGNPKQVKLTPEQIDRLRQLERQRGKVSIQDVHKATAPPVGGEQPKPGTPAPPAAGRPSRHAGQKPETSEGEGEEDKKGGGGGGTKRPGEVAGRDSRHKARQDKGRQSRSVTDRGAIIIGAGGTVDIIEETAGSRAKVRRGHKPIKKPVVATGGKLEIALPITVRALSEAIGIKAGELILKLKNLTNSLYTINSNVDFEVAELVATDRNIELVAKKQETAEDVAIRKLQEDAAKSDPANLIPRPPIVTIMGHVDHGKTSLLDKIRQTYGLTSDVVSTEAGGITQVLRAWRVDKDGKSTTFLDTPGHEAFTKMRARGANVTDIAVIVVSASDGVMPQTEEAINHAKAADVDLVVAINKVDLPDANIDRTRRQLYQLGLLPDNMGGDVPFVECSAKTGLGIDELLDSIHTLAELSEPPLQADPTLAGSGTCLEAYMEGEKGVIATLLVRNGTLRRGDVVLCGATFGRVRAMYDDLGRPIEEAGPSVPVKFIGLNHVPDADDPFFAVDDIGTAREIANRRSDLKQEAALSKFSPVSLDKLKEHSSKAKISELKVILKAEARGSVEAIRKELEKLLHDEVRVRVLHSGIGAITESDVTLALTSPEDTLIVGFNVTADDPALLLAEQRGISIREYQIIYNLVDDVKAALEGRLKPVEEVVHLGRAVIRETFKISKVGTIAGCYVTSGNIERSARVRVIRDGAVLYPQGEKVVGLDSLKRFKDDVRDVREGFECGLKITGFDDVKVGDVIEAFRIEIKQRTL